MRRFPILRILKWFAIVLVVLILGVGTLAYLESTNILRHVAGQQGSDKLGRRLAIDGDIKIDWGWQEIGLHLGDINLANDDKGAAKDPQMVAIQQLDLRIRPWDLLKGEINLPMIELTKPRIVLEKYDADNANWQLPAMSPAKAAVPDSRSTVPVIGQLIVHDGQIVYRDDEKKLDVTLSLDTASAGGEDGKDARKGDFKITGDGTLQGKKFTLKAQGGSLDMLHDTSVDYPLYFDLRMGATHIMIDGTFKDPVKMEGVDTKLEISGDNMADLFYLTTIPLPPSPRYSIAGHLVKQGSVWKFEDFKGRVGGSDLNGNLSYDISNKRNFMQAQLVSHKLDIKDLGGFVGLKPKVENGQTVEEKPNTASDRVLPDLPLDLSRLRAIDMDVSLKAESIIAPNLPLDNMDVRFLLKDGVLKVDPLNFGVAKGRVEGNLVLDGTKPVPDVKVSLGLTRLSLKAFFNNPKLAKMTEGRFGGRFDFAGTGKSFADVLGDSNGRITFVIQGGELSELIVDAAGLDLGNATPLLIDTDKPTVIRCGVADFGDVDGMLTSKVFVIDTNVSTITGDAKINLKNEGLDLEVSTEPKSPTITAHTPILLKGTMKNPAVSIDPTELAARGAIAIGLSVVATPLAAIIPFIHTGLGDDDADCSALIKNAQTKQAQPKPPAAPTH